jgi:amino acid adenylation domain-containing protein
MIFDLFERLAESVKTPNLFGDHRGVLTRAASRELVGRIASAIDLRLGHKRQAAVAILLPRDAYYLASIFATWEAGHHFIPLNVTWPREHLSSILSTAKPDLLITPAAETGLGVDILSITDAIQFPLPDDSQRQRWSATRASPGLAYIIYTSGSTGEQKGVMISKKAYQSYINWTRDYFSAFAANRALLITAELTFDITMGDLAFALAFGSEIHVSPDPRNMFFHAKLIKDREIDTFYSVPSTISRLFGWVEGRSDLDFSGIQLVMAGGDAFSPDLISTVKRVAPSSAFYNVYGPTEVTINCCAVRVDDRVEAIHSKGVVPIGLPFSHLDARLLDPDFSDRFVEHSGELVVAGSQCMDGYLHDSERTTNSFVAIGGKIYYRTGDLVEFGDDGFLYILGRIDKLVKIKGYRINPSEIDNILLNEEWVTEVRTIAINPNGGESVLVSVAVVREAGVSDLTETLLERCRQKLPAYMVPARIVCIDSIPLGVSGKYDNNTLKMIAAKLFEQT